MMSDQCNTQSEIIIFGNLPWLTMTSSGSDSFRGISPAEFFYRNRQMAGFSNPTQALYTGIRELVENSLDSCEDAGVLPKIDVRVSSIDASTVQITVSDNGTGVPVGNIPEAFARVLYGSKYDLKQRRGTFGMGVTMTVLYGQITTDSPVLVHTRTKTDDGQKCSLFIDVEKNVPIIDSIEPSPRKELGTTVSVKLHADVKRSKERIIEYIRLTCLATPCARIVLVVDQDFPLVFGGFSKDLPAAPVVVKPHPRAADLELLRRTIKMNETLQLHDFLVDTFQQVGPATAKKFLRFMNMGPKVKVGSLSRSDLITLSTSLRKYDEFSRPTADCLSPIGRIAFTEAVRSEYKTSAVSYAQRGSLEWDGNPFIIEGVLVLDDSFERSETPSLFRFANKVPLLYDVSEDVFTKVLKRIPWNRYGIVENNRVGIFVHFCSTRVPYSAAGKQSISSVGMVESEIQALYRDLGRSLKKISDRKRQKSAIDRRYKEFSRTFKLLTKFSSEVAGSESLPSVDSMIQALFEVNPDV